MKLVLVAVITALTLVACGGGGSSTIPPSQTPTPPPSGLYTVSITELGSGGAGAAAVVRNASAHPMANSVQSNLVVLGNGQHSQFTEDSLVLVMASAVPVAEASPPALGFSNGAIAISTQNPPQANDGGWTINFQFPQEGAAPTQTTVTTTFSNATGTATVDTYDSFALSCTNGANVDVSGGTAVTVPSSSATIDLSVANCSGSLGASNSGDVTFANGYMVAAQAVLNSAGSALPAFASYLTVQPFVSAGTTLTAAQLATMDGDIIQAPDSNGVQHKYMLVANTPEVFLQLTSSAGAFAF